MVTIPPFGKRCFQSGRGVALRRVVTILCVAVLGLVVTAGAYSTVVAGPSYGQGTYGPGAQAGGPYDCPSQGVSWVANSFIKGAARLGKSIFIDGNGNWIAAKEDSNSITYLNRPDLEGSHKKGSVKNTSSYTYSATGVSYYDDAHACI